jgi:hypothetical protein
MDSAALFKGDPVVTGQAGFAFFPAIALTVLDIRPSVPDLNTSTAFVPPTCHVSNTYKAAVSPCPFQAIAS